MGVFVMKTWAAFESLAKKFQSGNDIPVERATILREEWEALMAARAIQVLTGIYYFPKAFCPDSPEGDYVSADGLKTYFDENQIQWAECEVCGGQHPLGDMSESYWKRKWERERRIPLWLELIKQSS